MEQLISRELAADPVQVELAELRAMVERSGKTDW